MHDNLVITLPVTSHQPHGPAFADIQLYTIYASVYHDLAICHLAWAYIEHPLNRILDLLHLNKAAPFCVLRHFKMRRFL